MSDDTALADIVEVEEQRKNVANGYLGHGYRLIGMNHAAILRPAPPKSSMPWSHYVARFTTYILGRPDGIDHWEPIEDEAESSAAAPQP